MGSGYRELWAQLDAAKHEYDTAQKNVESWPGWKFVGRLPNGLWCARSGRLGHEVREKTAQLLIDRVRAINVEASNAAALGGRS